MVTQEEANSSEIIGISNQQGWIVGLAFDLLERERVNFLEVVRLRTQRKQVFRVLLGDNLWDHYFSESLELFSAVFPIL